MLTKRILVIFVMLALISSSVSVIADSSSNWFNDSTVGTLCIPDSVDGVVTNGQMIGSINASTHLNVVISLPFSNQSQLDSFLEAVQNPQSIHYHHYLTSSEFDKEFSPNAVEYTKYVTYFASQGFQVRTFTDKVSISLSGSASQFEALFHSTIERFQSVSSEFYAPHNSLTLSVNYGPISSVIGLSSQFEPKISPLFEGSGSSQTLYGADFQEAYQLSELYQQYGYPTTETIATILWAGTDSSGNPVAPYVPSDIDYYFANNMPSGEPTPNVYGYPILGAPVPGSSATNDNSQANLESTLDLEMAGSVAPGSNVVEVYGPSSTESDLDQAFASILNPSYNTTVDNALEEVVAISNSWGGSDNNDSTWMQYEQEAAGRGITVLASSGDDGDTSSPAPEYPATESYSTFGTLAVGGTNTQLTGTASTNGSGTTGIQTQSVWYNTPNSGDGSQGGVSSIFSEPAWQTGSTDANGVITGSSSITGVASGRGTPDIAADGANMEIYVTWSQNGGSNYLELWGTSVASPLTAGVIAVMDHALGPPEGFMNPIIYRFGQEQYSDTFSGPAALYFVSNGSNAEFSAENGYSLADGWGSINSYNFVQAQRTIYPTYLVTFSETGLPVGVDWYVNLSPRLFSGPISSSNTYSFALPNGTYSYTLGVNTKSYTAQSGEFTVNGGILSVPIAFNKAFAVTFSEYGLPAGSVWYVNLSGGSLSGEITGGTYILDLLNGTYSYTIGTNSGYLASPNSGSLTVNGVPLNIQPISFSAQSGKWIYSKTMFNLTQYLSEGISVTATNPASVEINTDYTQFQVNSTSTYVPESYGNYSINIQKIDYLLDHNDISDANANMSLNLGGGTSYSYSGVNTFETFVAGSEKLLTLTTYDSSYLSTLNFNGTAFMSNFGLPSIWLNFSTPGSITIYSASNNYNGQYFYKHTFTTDADMLYFNSTDNGYSQSLRNMYYGWSVGVTPIRLLMSEVNFTESGLPSGSLWYVNLSTGLNSGQIEAGSTYLMYLTNGTYLYSASTNDSVLGAPDGQLTVGGGVGTNISVVFSGTTWPVTFSESGLPSGSDWYVNLTSGENSGPISAGSTYIFQMVAGKHEYTYSTSDQGYGAKNTTGSVDVAGQASLTVTFVELYRVVFTESGLVPGLKWYVNLTNGLASGAISTTSYDTYLMNGTYTFNIGVPLGYLASPRFGTFTVSGSQISIPAISFELQPSSAEWISSHASFNVTAYLREQLSVSTINPASVNFSTHSTQYVVNSTSTNVPESYGNYTLNIGYIDDLMKDNDIVGKYANLSLSLSGGTSYSYSGVRTNETFVVGSETLLTLTTYVSSYESVLDFNGTTFNANYALPTIWLNFSTPGSITIYSASNNYNGQYFYKHTFTTDADMLYFNSTDNGYSQSLRNMYYGWSVQVNPLKLGAYPVDFSETGLPTNVFWFVNLSTGLSSGPILPGSAYTASLPNGSYAYSVETDNPLYGANSSTFKVQGGSNSVIITFKRVYSVTFSESGLPSGSDWYLNLSSVQHSGPILAGFAYKLSLPNGTYMYSTSSNNPAFGPEIPVGSFTISGGSLSESILFASAYSVSFSETGLPVGTEWYVNLSNGQSFSSETTSVSFQETDGVYYYTISTTNKTFSPSSYSGSFTVNGGNVVVSSISFSPFLYEVTFKESGLPSGSEWFINLTGESSQSASAGSFITFSLTNGTYSYTIATSDKEYYNSTGAETLSLQGGSPSSLTVNFALKTYSVELTQSGLPTGIVWYFNVTNSSGITDSYSGSGNFITCSCPNGTYTYEVATSNKSYEPSTHSGSFDVDGLNIHLPQVTFTLVTYQVTFTQSGLPADTTWYVNLTNGQSYSSSGSTVSFSEINGTYAYVVATSNKTYSPSMYGGTVTVNGGSSSVSEVFLEVNYSIQFSESDLPSGATWYINLSGSQSYSSTSTIISFDEPNGTYSFTVSTADKVFAPTYYFGSFVVQGANVKIATIDFQLITYQVSFSENGLPSPLAWYVNVTNSTGFVFHLSGTGTISTYLPNGTYTFTVASSNKTYAPSMYSGSFVVAGTTPSISPVKFSVVTYAVSFFETGLPAYAVWYVNITNSTGKVFTHSGTGTITFSLFNGSYGYSIASPNKIYVPSSYGGLLLISGATASRSITFAAVTYSVVFSETGLPSGTTWYVNLTDFTNSVTSLYGTGSLTFSLVNGSYTYTISTVNKNYASSTYSGSFTVSGSGSTKVITFNPVFFSVTYSEVGLPSLVNWYVNITNSSLVTTSYHGMGTVTFSLINGSYTYAVSSTDKNYAPTTYAGGLTVSGAAVSKTITFAIVTYSITFNEMGLPPATIWYLNVTDSTGSMVSGHGIGKLGFTLENGSYTYSMTSTNRSYAPGSYTGSFTIMGSDVSTTISFNPVKYAVTFTETGLPTYAIWYVNVTNSSGLVTSYSESGTITVGLMNGTYTFTIASSNKIYTPSQYTGPLSVSGSALTEALIFTQVNYTATFLEKGLPSETVAWYVNISILTASGVWSPIASGSTKNEEIGFTSLVNGTYSYSISSVNRDYVPTVYSGSFVISGDNLSVNISFAPVLYSVTFSETGLPSGSPWYVNISGEPSSGPIYGLSYSITLMNGSYSFKVSNTSKYYTSSYEGNLKVVGGVATQSIQFIHYSYISGTLNPANATLEINGNPVALSSGHFNVTVPAGSYELVATLNGYYTSYSNVTLQSNQTKTLSLNLTKIPNNKRKTNTEIFLLIGGVAGAIAVAGVVVLLLMRRRK